MLNLFWIIGFAVSEYAHLFDMLFRFSIASQVNNQNV